MSHTPIHFPSNTRDTRWLVIVLLAIVFALPQLVYSAVYGVRKEDGTFVPKIAVSIKPDQITITKYNKKEKFSSISFVVNTKNKRLVRDIQDKKLKIQWIAPGAIPRMELPFAGNRFNEKKMIYQDNMTRSIGVKIKNKADPKLFKNKELSELFTIYIDGQICEAQEASGAHSDGGTIRLGGGSGDSIEIQKDVLKIDRTNVKSGTMTEVVNRSGSDLTIGVTFPKVGLTYTNIVRGLEQSKLPREEWDRFSLRKNDKIQLFVIADPSDPNKLAQLNGSQITVKVWDGDRIKETKSIAIDVDPELLRGTVITGPQPPTTSENNTTRTPIETNQPTESVKESTESRAPVPKTENVPRHLPVGQESSGTLWLWIFQIFNFTLLLTLACYGIFFMLPKIQVLEDRLAKSEMFIHGSREAIREELEEIKREILQQCRIQPGQE